MIGDIFRIIFNLVMLPILSGLFLGALLYVFLSFKKQYEIKDVVFTQALSEKIKFKSVVLNKDFDIWQKKKIEKGELR
ncbi:hypothetical protein O8C76_02455 [Aliarcobacter butzleri]|uniref:Uncharacterized protein n=1 Tax=Aliarcobacter butzleri TaxID=28197 RepID=A0AAW7PWF0_9BACT|nr:hypothetical protein [Aliarcobacter butzleri]MDN5069889.1 hypothetical protein [Aliarcobacter butzleri]